MNVTTNDFQVEVLTVLGELKAEQAATTAEVRNIVARLDKLNGTVARHTEEIGRLQLESARRQGSEAAVSTWTARLWPMIYACLGAGVSLVLQHGPAALAAIRH
jgi:septal ring factor EnvC (AmiA/AmiB activator)